MRLLAAALCLGVVACGDRVNTIFDDYGRSVSVIHTQEGLQGPILVEVGQFDGEGRFLPIAVGTGETLLQSVIRGSASAALTGIAQRPNTTNINASGGSGGGAGSGSTSPGSPGGVINVNTTAGAQSGATSTGSTASGGTGGQGGQGGSATVNRQ
jgi:hypothetical protein